MENSFSCPLQVKFNKDNDDTKAANKFAKEQGSPKLRAMIVEVIKKLQEQAGAGQKIPKDGATPTDSPQPEASPLPAAAPVAHKPAAPPSAEKKKPAASSVGCPLPSIFLRSQTIKRNSTMVCWRNL